MDSEDFECAICLGKSDSQSVTHKLDAGIHELCCIGYAARSDSIFKSFKKYLCRQSGQLRVDTIFVNDVLIVSLMGKRVGHVRNLDKFTILLLNHFHVIFLLRDSLRNSKRTRRVQKNPERPNWLRSKLRKFKEKLFTQQIQRLH